MEPETARGTLNKLDKEVRLPSYLTIIPLFFAIALSYPMSGALYAISCICIQAYNDPMFILNHPGAAVFTVLLWAIFVPLFHGFVPANEGDVGPRINMYPWIIPTACVLFLLFSPSWRRAIRQRIFESSRMITDYYKLR